MEELVLPILEKGGLRCPIATGIENENLACDFWLAFSPEREEDLVALDEALTELAELDPRQSQVIELRFFGGLSLKETAEALQISVASVRRDWALARAWLHRRLSRETHR